MRMLFTMVALAVMAVSAPAGATPQDHVAPDCTGKTAELPAGMSGWTARSPAASSANEAGLANAIIEVGKGADAALHGTGGVTYVTRPEKPGGSVSHGGMFAFTVTEAGTYRVALGAKAWIDVLGDGKVVESSAHGHGPDCSGIRKMVDFPLTPGRYVLQLAAAAEPTISVLVAKLP